MTSYEFLTLLVSLLAVILSAVSLFRTRRTAIRQLALQEITAELSKKQLEKIKESEEDAKKTFIEVKLVSLKDYNKFVICNVGEAEAKNVSIKVLGDYNPIVSNDFEDKIPIKSLRPRQEVSLLSVSELGTPSSFEVEVSWENPTGEICVVPQTVYE